MSTVHTVCARLCATFFVLLFCSTAFGDVVKVDVCHFPPDDLDNFHTIRITENAADSHYNHGDLEGACEVDPADTCPCFSQADLDALNLVQAQTCTIDDNLSLIMFETAGACSGLRCSTIAPTSGCIFVDASIQFESDLITTDEDAACRSIILETCSTSP